MGLAYSFAFLLVFLLGAPWWLVRMATSGRYRAGLGERLGFGLDRLGTQRAGRKTLWLHAVSVGEVLAAEPLIHALQAALPDRVFAISTTTETGQLLARERFPACIVFYLPLDFASTTRRVLRALEPELLILMESELWPRLLAEANRAGVPVAVANARISDRSYPRYMRLRALWRPLLQRVSLFLAQSQETATRLAAIGAPADRIHAVGNLKFDAPEPTITPLTRTLREVLPPAVPVLVAGSTLDGEEAMLLNAWQTISATTPTMLLLAPRHAPRWNTVADLLTTRGIPFVRASTWFPRDAAPNPPWEYLEPATVLLLDTIGDLASVYALSTVAFVGGSLIDAGGHNPLEPARFAVPIVQGPSFANFREIVQTLTRAEAIRIVQPTELTATLAELLHDPSIAQTLGENAQRVFQAHAGARARTVDALLTLLHRESQ